VIFSILVDDKKIKKTLLKITEEGYLLISSSNIISEKGELFLLNESR